MVRNEVSGGMKVFAVVWLGQVVSLVGSGLTSFALGLWVYEQTGSVTKFALIALATTLPRILLSPPAGAIVDRWDRRTVMLLADAGAGLSTLAMALLLFWGRLEVWHIYLGAGIGAAFGTFQWPAYSAATTLLVPKKHLGRANGMVQFGQAASEITAPLLAGVLVLRIGVWGVMLVDFATFIFAVATLLLVRFPGHRAVDDGEGKRGSLLGDSASGWTYITGRPGLLGLLLFFAAVNFLWGMVGALIVPMVLDFTSADVLGAVISVAGFGMLSGSLLMSAWGGPKRRIEGVLGFEMISGLCFMLIGLRPSAWLVAAGAFGAHLTIAVVYGSDRAIWQSKVEPGMQGRVFAAQQMVARSTSPLAYLVAGPLADRVFGPVLAEGGTLAGSVGQLVGVGPGRGIGLLFILMGLLKVAVVLAGYMYPRVRLIEDELPDAIESA